MSGVLYNSALEQRVVLVDHDGDVFSTQEAGNRRFCRIALSLSTSFLVKAGRSRR